MLNKEKHYMTSVTKVTNTILSTRFAMHLSIRNIEANDWELGAYPHLGLQQNDTPSYSVRKPLLLLRSKILYLIFYFRY
jgi:hypothetical protein